MGSFCVSPILGGGCSDSTSLERCKGDLKSHGAGKKHPLVLLCAIILLKKCLNQRFLGRSDVRVNSNAVNSTVLLTVNFPGRSCQLGSKAAFLLEGRSQC